LLVAADGAKSRLREAAGIKLVALELSQTGIVAIVRLQEPHHGRAVQHFLPGGPFAILPLTGNRACITWDRGAGRAREILALDDAGFRAEIEARFDYRLGAVELAGPRASWPSTCTWLGHGRHRLALVGDAAHGVHPIAGQGLNWPARRGRAVRGHRGRRPLGLDFGSPAVLERYERWRRLDSALSAATFDALNRLCLQRLDCAPHRARFRIGPRRAQAGPEAAVRRRSRRADGRGAEAFCAGRGCNGVCTLWVRHRGLRATRAMSRIGV
jgi:2-octaprenyl-6-methoxyphenol hydroxylase